MGLVHLQINTRIWIFKNGRKKGRLGFGGMGMGGGGSGGDEISPPTDQYWSPCVGSFCLYWDVLSKTSAAGLGAGEKFVVHNLLLKLTAGKNLPRL